MDRGSFIISPWVAIHCENGFQLAADDFVETRLGKFWYRRSERAKRIAAFYMAGSFSGAIGGLLSAGIIQLDGRQGLYGWQWLFLLEGLISIIVGVAAWIWLPDYPRTTKWLDADERQFLEARLHDDGGSNSQGLAWVPSEAIAFAKNPLSYLFPIGGFLVGTITYGLSYYAPIIIASFGFTSTAAIAMAAPLGVWGMLCMMTIAWSSDRLGDRFWHLVFICACPMLGYALLAALPATATGVKLFGRE